MEGMEFLRCTQMDGLRPGETGPQRGSCALWSWICPLEARAVSSKPAVPTFRRGFLLVEGQDGLTQGVVRLQADGQPAISHPMFHLAPAPSSPDHCLRGANTMTVLAWPTQAPRKGAPVQVQ